MARMSQPATRLTNLEVERTTSMKPRLMEPITKSTLAVTTTTASSPTIVKLTTVTDSGQAISLFQNKEVSSAMNHVAITTLTSTSQTVDIMTSTSLESQHLGAECQGVQCFLKPKSNVSHCNDDIVIPPCDICQGQCQSQMMACWYLVCQIKDGEKSVATPQTDKVKIVALSGELCN